MGKTPGKWIKTLLLGKKSPKSILANGSEKMRSTKKEELVVLVKDDVSNLSADPSVVSSQPVPAQNNGDESKVNLESGNDLEEVELEQAVIKVQAAFRAHQARRAFRVLKGIIRLQALIRGHLVRRQAVATYSCILGIVKFQALVRGQKARSSHNGIQLQKRPMEARDSEALQLSTYSWMDNPPKLFIVDMLLASSPTVLPLKIKYGPEEPNSANVWLERWTLLQVWSPRSRPARILIPKSKTKKRNFQEVIETEKARPKRGVKKPSGPNSGTGSSRSTAETDKPKRIVRKASSTLTKDPLRTESGKAKQNLRKSRSASKEGSPLGVKDEKPKPGLKKSSLSNKSEKDTLKSAEKKKDTADPVQVEGSPLDVKDEKPKPSLKRSSLSNESEKDILKSAEKKKDTTDPVQVEPKGKVSGDVLEGGDNSESAEKEKDTADGVPIESNVEKDENSPVLDKQEDDEPKTAETSDKGEDIKCSDVKISTENGNDGSDNTKPSERRVSLPAKIDNRKDGLTHSGRKIPSYMAPTVSAKARVKGEGSLGFAQEKTEKNGTMRRHSLNSPANGNVSTTTTMSPRAHRLLLASAKGSTNGDKSFSSTKDISDKPTRAEWKR